MPDVTTPTKGLTQPQVGGDNNAWGGLLNTNLSLIDSAIGGMLSLSVSGNTTLSSTQAQNAGYEFTGTLSGTTTITWPTFYGIAAIQNGTAGGHSITCGMSGGGTVTVLNGETVAIWSDGTNFARLAQVGGGIGTTGTGSVVLATAPTIASTLTMSSGGIALADSCGPYWGAGTEFVSGNATAHAITMNTNSLTRLVIDTNGNVTVGATIDAGDVIVGVVGGVNPTITFVGDSLTFGIGSSSPNFYPFYHYITMPTYNGQALTVTGLGVGGRTLLTMYQDSYLNLHPCYSHLSGLNIVVIWGGTNDFAAGSTPAEVLSILEAFCRHERELGALVVVGTLMDSTPFEAQHDAFNALLRTRWTQFADAIFDAGADSLLGLDGCSTNLTYFQSDGIHLTDAGYSHLGGIVQPVIEALILGYNSYPTTGSQGPMVLNTCGLQFSNTFGPYWGAATESIVGSDSAHTIQISANGSAQLTIGANGMVGQGFGQFNAGLSGVPATIGRLSDAPTYNMISFNEVVTTAGISGLYSSGSDQSLYVASPSLIEFKVANGVEAYFSSGLVSGSPTGGAKGVGSINAQLGYWANGVEIADNSGNLFTNTANFVLRSKTTITGGGTSNTPTLSAGPVAGNPTKWLPYDDNGTTRYIPAW